MQQTLDSCQNLEIIEGTVEDLVVEQDKVQGVVLGTGEVVNSGQVVLTTGTFLGAMVHVGTESFPAGRMGDAAVHGLSKTLERFGFTLGRLRTGEIIKVLLISV